MAHEGDDKTNKFNESEPSSLKLQRTPEVATIVADATRFSGRCLWFDFSKNFGAIENAGDPGNLIFVHGNDVDTSKGQLMDGDIVECGLTLPGCNVAALLY